MDTINILFLTSVPAESHALNTDAEFRKIEDALEESPKSTSFRLFRHARLRREELEHTLSTFHPQVVHFSGHGTAAGALLLEDPNGRRWDLDRDTLRTVFKAYGQSVKLAVLNACHSEAAGNTLREVVPYVVGNSIEVYDGAAIEFATTFYRTLFQGETLSKSFRAACKAAGAIDNRGGQIPQLLDTPNHPDPRQVKPLENWAAAESKSVAPAQTKPLESQVGVAPSRAELRVQMNNQLKTDADLDAFALDEFPTVKMRWSSGMDRTAKVTLLLQLQEPRDIAVALARWGK